MTEAEWNVKRELLLTKQQLYQAQSAVLQHEFNKVTAELAAMGPAWVDPALLAPNLPPEEVAH